MFTLLNLFLFCSVNILSAQSSHIHVQPNGGYTNVVIAISDRNIQSALLLKQLEDFLHEVSKSLQLVTNNNTFLHEVRILVPQSWNVSSYIPSTFENYYSADIHLDTFNPVQQRGNVYAQRARECGGKGNFIYLNTQFLNEWHTTRDQSKGDIIVNKFVQEWVKLRYEILQYLIHDPPFFPCHSKNISGTTDLSAYEIDHHHVIFQQMHNYEKQVSSLLNQRHKHDLYSFPVKIQYVKLASLQIVLVIDPNLCVNFATKGSHMLSLAIQKFLRNTEKNSTIGCVIADDRTTNLDLDTRSPDLFSILKIRSMAKSFNIQKRNLTKGVEKGIAMFSHPSASSNHVIVFADGMSTQSFAALTTIQEKYPHVNLFLITWTPIGKNLSQSSDLVKQFDYNFHKHFWMDIKMKSTIDECDADARNQVDEVFAFFFEKFQNDDFYPKKIKIVTSKLQNLDSFVNPKNNPLLIFKYNFCKIDIEKTVVNLKINDVDYSEKLSHDGIVNLLSSTYLWNDTSDKDPVVTYKWTDYFNLTSASSVWVYNENKTPTKHILNVEVRQKKLSQINTSHPLIVHAFSPNEYSVVAEIKSQSGETFSIDLRDNGNGDPDVLAGDKIYSRYLLHPGADDLYSVSVLTKDFNGNVIMKTNVGSFNIPRGDKHPPNRIGDFRFEEKQDRVTFLWTAPGGDHDHYSADKYYMKCSEAYKNVSDGFDPTSEEELSMTPKKSGEMETYVWTRPSQTTVYYCVMMSVDFDGIFGEASNVNTVPVVSIDEQNSLLTGMLGFKIGLIIGGFVILVGLSLTVARCVNKKKQEPPHRVPAVDLKTRY